MVSPTVLIRADGPDVLERVPRLGERRDLHDVARVGRMEKAAAADVDADVVRAGRPGLEEDEVAWSELGRRDPLALVPLRAREVRQVDPELGVDEHREPGAVEPRRGRRAA